MRFTYQLLFYSVFMFCLFASMVASAELLFHDDFEKDNTPFDDINPATEGNDGTFETGKFGNYGLVYIDNLFIGDKVEDLVLPVDPKEKLSTTWSAIKALY